MDHEHTGKAKIDSVNPPLPCCSNTKSHAELNESVHLTISADFVQSIHLRCPAWNLGKQQNWARLISITA
jgi:hypothetical protein